MSTYSISFSGGATSATAGLGSKDGRGCGDHDEPYKFGRRPRAIAPFPFTPSQYARVLVLRGCVTDGLLGDDDLDTPSQPTRPDQPSFSSTCSCDPKIPSGDQLACAGCARDRAARGILQAAGVLAEN
jgi:hypothetical protein